MHFEPLDRAECLRLLRKQSLGRLVYTANGLPVVQPVSYLLRGDSVVILIESTNKLAATGRREVVAFEVDDIDGRTGAGWIVQITGQARALCDHAELARISVVPLQSSAISRPSTYIRISGDLVIGRRLGNE